MLCLLIFWCEVNVGTLKTDRRPFLSHITVSHVVVVLNLVRVPGRLVGRVVVLHLKIFE